MIQPVIFQQVHKKHRFNSMMLRRLMPLQMCGDNNILITTPR